MKINMHEIQAQDVEMTDTTAAAQDPNKIYKQLLELQAKHDEYWFKIKDTNEELQAIVKQLEDLDKLASKESSEAVAKMEQTEADSPEFDEADRLESIWLYLSTIAGNLANSFENLVVEETKMGDSAEVANTVDKALKEVGREL